LGTIIVLFFIVNPGVYLQGFCTGEARSKARRYRVGAKVEGQGAGHKELKH
jgi:hypothetical protein